MVARLAGVAFAAPVLLFALMQPADARKRIAFAPATVAGAVIDDRYPHLREPEAHASARAWRKSGDALAGIVAPLAEKAAEIVARCGARVVSGVRRSFVRGTRTMSLHASGRAVDVAGNPTCIYRALAGWPGGYSTDYVRVRHVHISYAPKGREWGARFAHTTAKVRTRRRGAAA